MLSNDLKYANVDNEIRADTAWKFEKCYFQHILLNWIISVIYVAKLIKIGTHVVQEHLEEPCLRFVI